MTQDTSTSAALVRIQISNLPSGATESQVRAAFLPHGEVQFYDRPLNQHTQQPGPLAYVEMVPAAGAVAIKALNGARLGGDVLKVTAATPSPAWAPSAARGPRSPLPRRLLGDDAEPGSIEHSRGDSA